MKSLADALDGAITWFQQFRMCQSQVTPANDFGLLLLGQSVPLIAEQFVPVLLKPNRQTLPFLRCQAKNRTFELFQAHVTQFIKPEHAGESQISYRSGHVRW
ncbi:MAG: hypothetical protein DMF41_08160 [Verrucomicrobia bacterium]|nr:MAG: hypothetical protein DMF41_08160 [Verrucomicrobiota bacterium]